MTSVAAVPMRDVGPVYIVGSVLNEEISIPLATFETPLWPSTSRGARLTRKCGGVQISILDDRMSRSVLLEGPDAGYIAQFIHKLAQRESDVRGVIEETGQFIKFLGIHTQVVGNLLYLRLEVSTGDASGHNMVTKAADKLMEWVLQHYPEFRYVSVSGNYCTDKKASAVNGILGRGKYVVAEMMIPAEHCEKYLKTTPERVVELNIKKNLIGTLLAGTVRSANAHFANMLLAFYIATGQDPANVVEGSQGIVHAEVRGGDLYFSTTLPNVIVGTVGNGKDIPFVQENLQKLGCLEERVPGENALRLAAVATASVFCGELSLLAAQTNQGELIRSHIALERANKGRAA